MKKKEFEDFPREYEKVYSPPEIINKKCDIGKVSAFNGIPGDTTTYLLLFQETVKKFQRESFDSLVKITWLQNRFCYKGIHRTKTRWNGMEIDGAYGCFMKGYVGMSNLTLVHTNDWSRWIISYFKDFFPNFNEGNPEKPSPVRFS